MHLSPRVLARETETAQHPDYCGAGLAYQLEAVSARLLLGRTGISTGSDISQATVGMDWHINWRRYQPGYCGGGLAYQLEAVSARLLQGRTGISTGGGISQATTGKDWHTTRTVLQRE
jgi:hypothetical protein